MARCEVCGNDYDKSFSIELNGRKHLFDSFECAIQALAPSAHTAIAESSVMGWKVGAGFIVAPIVRVRQVFLRWPTGRRRFPV
jgi:hypothetical protein